MLLKSVTDIFMVILKTTTLYEHKKAAGLLQKNKIGQFLQHISIVCNTKLHPNQHQSKHINENKVIKASQVPKNKK